MWKPLETFIEYVEKESQGRVKIKAFHSAQLFDGYEELPALSRGDIDITTVVSTYASGAMPVLNLFTMPFVFQDTAHLERAAKAGLLDVSIRGEMRDKHGIEVLGLAPIDPYQIYSRRAPVRTAADFRARCGPRPAPPTRARSSCLAARPPACRRPSCTWRWTVGWSTARRVR